MSADEVQKLSHGLYRLFWKSGGSSLAAVGSMYNGRRWMAPTNWTADQTKGQAPNSFAQENWDDVDKAALLLKDQPE